ncbi:MAG: hypothetical protein ACD_9C00269G0003 [uncultured bacterium]|nr:MAG: hypothetical protein ACD_9C00269G0003 [uncultured bacterium]
MKRGLFQYIADLWYGATKYPFGGLKPKVVLGYFSSCEVGYNQKLFFDELRSQGFKRTIWQLIFPGQIAGLIKNIPRQSNGTNEYHIRFYNDGTIDCELEIARFDRLHWVGPRQRGVETLEKLIDESATIKCIETREKIKKLFGDKPYSENCLRSV